MQKLKPGKAVKLLWTKAKCMDNALKGSCTSTLMVALMLRCRVAVTPL